MCIECGCELPAEEERAEGDQEGMVDEAETSDVAVA